MELARDDILRLLQELDQWMEFEDCPSVDWVVCGGAALAGGSGCGMKAFTF